VPSGSITAVFSGELAAMAHSPMVFTGFNLEHVLGPDKRTPPLR